MGLFDDIMARGADALMRTHARSTQVTYHSPYDEPTDVNAMLGPINTREDDIGDGELDRVQTRIVTLLRDTANPAFGGVVDPGEHGTIEIDDEHWTIEAIELQSATETRLRCVRPAIAEHARGSHRR